MKRIAVITLVGLLAFVSQAEAQTVDQLLASKKKADMTYRQLMEIMGSASSMIHQGILRENKQMVKTGANIILNHPAPNHKPWSIMQKSDQKEFKKSLMSYNKVLDSNAERVAKEAGMGKWRDASKSAHELSISCAACHSSWRNKVK